MTSDYDHDGICDGCGWRVGVHGNEGRGGVRVLPQGWQYEARCSCGRGFGPKASAEQALDLLGDHVMTVENCPCPCHAGTYWPRSIEDCGG
jgi:hypothetical protein